MTFTDSDSAQNEHGHIQTFRHSALGIEFCHPAGWRPVFSNGPLVVLPPDARQIPESGGVWLVAFSLTVGRNADFRRSPSATLQAFCESNASNFQAYSLVSREDFPLATGQQAIRLVFDFQKAAHEMRAHAVIAIRDDLLVLLDASGLRSNMESDMHAWDEYVMSLRLPQ